MNKTIILGVLLFSVITILHSCKDGDDTAFFNNTNETVLDITIPADYVFDRKKTNVVVAFYDNEAFKGEPAAKAKLKMIDTKENGKEKETENANQTRYNLLKKGNYYAMAFIDLNGNEKKDYNEPSEIFGQDGIPQKIKTLKESRRTVSFDFKWLKLLKSR